jgi:drug/metabolite transporter (DMT)-like permease
VQILSYGATVVLYLAVRKKLDRKVGAFDLGAFEVPVAVIALVWLIGALFVLVTPGAALIPILIVVGLLALGGIYFLGLLMFNRVVLLAEPSTSSVVTP